MDLRILPLLTCPVSSSSLDFVPIETENHGGREIARTGILGCHRCRIWYPVVNYVPVLLTFPTQLARHFQSTHAACFGQFGGYRMPDQEPAPGERSVQKTFTEEWAGLGDDQRTFVYSDGELMALHRDVWLRFTQDEIDKVDTVLNVGCGFGKEAVILSQIFPKADVLGIDLNLSLLRAAPALVEQGRVHLVIASLFHLPFARQSFAHVHSQGVIHHTFSTRDAFRSISGFVRPGGSLFVWVYAQEDSLVVPGFRGLLIRSYWLVSHHIGRPILSRLPAPLRNAAMFMLAAAIYPVLKLRDRRRGDWHFRNTLHGLRDAFTPRYAHQHGFNEVIGWFEDEGYQPRLQSPTKYRDLIGRRLIGVGIVGRLTP